MGVPDNRTILQFCADINILYMFKASDLNGTPSLNFSLEILLTILLIKLCASSTTTAELSNIFFCKLSVNSLNFVCVNPL